MRMHLIQMRPKLLDKKTNLETMESYIEQAVKQKVSLVVFPELSLTGYMCRKAFAELAEPIPGPSTKDIILKAQKNKIYVIFGMAERKGDGIYNSAPFCGPNGIVGIWRKNYLPQFISSSGVRYEEKKYFRSSAQLNVFDTSFGKIGIQICYEIWFPEIARAQAMKGAWLLLNISAAPMGVPRIFRILGQTRALENTCWFGLVNQVGCQEGVSFGGGTCMVDYNGALTDSATLESKAKEEVLCCEVSPQRVFERRKSLPVLKDVRPQMIRKFAYLLDNREKGGEYKK
jgi:predicted amidohydrolase